MVLPVYLIEVAWTGDLTGVFTVGTSTVGGAYVVAGAFGANTFDDITAYAYGFGTVRGRPDDLGVMQQGTCSIYLHDRTGRFNPENASSDLYGYLVPLRPVRVSAIWNSSTYRLFTGYVDRIEFDPLTRRAQIDCADLFDFLNSGTQAFVAAATTAGAAVGEILDEIEYTDPSLRDLDTGRSLVQPGTAKDGSYLQQIGDVAAVDRGLFFMTGAGVARYISGSSYWAKSSPVGTLDGSVASDMRIAIDKQRIVNRVSVTGATAQTATNADSIAQYGYRDGDAISTLYTLTDAEAVSLGRWIVAQRGDPTVPARGIEVKSNTDTATSTLLSLEIGDRVTFSEPRGNTSAEGIVEGVEHRVQLGTLHATRFLVSKRTADAFTVGYSTVDGPDLVFWI